MKVDYTLDITGTLNDTEYAVLVQWATEMSREQIAEMFNRSAGWVDKTVGTIYLKLNVHTRQGAIHKAWKLGIFTAEDKK